MKQTTNYGFNKPELQDSPPDITVLNPNFDKIDGQLKSLTDKDTELNTAINQVKTDYLPKTGGNVTQGLTVKNKTVAVSVNGAVADANGNIVIDVGGDVQSVNGVQPDSNGNVVLDLGGDVQSVDGVEPDENGNVQLDALKQAEVLEATKRVTDVEVDPSVAVLENLQTSVAQAESNIEGLESSKLDKTTAHIIETWKSADDAQWYRKWSDGWIEQGGCITVYGWTTIPLLTPMKNTKYNIQITSQDANTDANIQVSAYINKTTTSFSTCSGVTDSSGYINDEVSWKVCGY